MISPYDTESYIHRIGRTGRAGREGSAILFVAPRERRMLFAIEQATRQKITPMTLPSRKDITERRVALFKAQVVDAMQSEDLQFFEELIDSCQQEYDVAPRSIAAALAYLLQKDRPLAPEEEEFDEPPSKQMEFTPAGRGSGDEGLQRYRIEVGKVHGVVPGHIVGAIANEANISNRDIGQIKIFHDFSLVDLPQNLPAPMFRHLQQVWICGQQLQLSVDRGAAQGGPSKRRPAGKAAAARKGKPFKKHPSAAKRASKKNQKP
ncbi:MAG: DbpA RNA binding domain-containing protein [Syntrophotaleaceae bacterium]